MGGLVSYAIQAHPSRSAMVADLQSRLGPVPVAWAAEPYATPYDRGPVWRTFRSALQLHTDAPFHCVIQDDALPCRDFTERLETLVTAGEFLYMLFWRPKRSYFTETSQAKRGLRHGYFIKVSGSMLGVGMAYPTDRIDDLIAFGDTLEPHLSDDERVKVWADDRGIRTYVPIPSLVDHRGDQSLVWQGGRRRVAWRFAR